MEGYGLLGFWLWLQILLGFCDLGFGAALVREFAGNDGPAGSRSRQRDLLRTMEFVYLAMAAVITTVIWASAHWLANDWLKLEFISRDEAAGAIKWMALALGLQFPFSLYMSGLAGLQVHGRMNLLQIISGTLRHAGGVAILLWKKDLVYFFCAQAVFAGVQTLATRVVLWKLIADPNSGRPSFRLMLLQQVGRFSAGMALSVFAGVALSNVDRLFISRLMTAGDLGRYTLAFTAAGILQMGIQPLYRTYFPRFSELVGMKAAEGLRSEYYQACRLMAKIIIPSSVLAALFAPILFSLWLGRSDGDIVEVFRWLLLGIATAGLMWMPAAFQQAHGWTSLHAAMMGATLCLGTVSLFWTLKYWGISGGTVVWVLHGVSDITLGLWLMHRRLLPGEFAFWYRNVVMPPLLCTVPIAVGSFLIMPANLGPGSGALWAGVTGVMVLIAIAISDVKALPLPAATVER